MPTELDNINFFEGKKVEDVGGWPEAKLTGLPLPVDGRVLTNTFVKGRPQTSYSRHFFLTSLGYTLEASASKTLNFFLEF